MRPYFVRYDSVDAQLQATKTMQDYYGEMSNWSGGRNMSASKDYVTRGASAAEISPVRELLDKIDASFPEGLAPAWVASPYGAYPVVPDYLAGDPFSMRVKTMVESPRAPIRVVLDVFVSAKVRQSTILQRGAAMAAFAQKLSELRPVELYLAGVVYDEKCGHDCGFMTRLNSTPIELAQLVACLTPSFCRMIGLNTVKTQTNCGLASALPFQCERHGRDSRTDLYIASCRRSLDLEPQDIYIGVGYLDDASLIDSDPVAWVHKQIEKQRRIDDESN